MFDTRQFYINGEWVDSVTKNDLDVINPSDESVCAVVSLGSQADTDAAVAAAKAALPSWSVSTKDERIALLERLYDIYERRMEDMAQAISIEMGAPIDFSRASQATSGTSAIKEFLRQLKKFEFEEQLDDSENRLLYEPKGVCALITPWNWPISQVALKVIPAIAAGCPVLIKPAPKTPLSCMVFIALLREAGCPEHMAIPIPTTNELAGKIVTDSRIGAFNFIGSASVGWQLRSKLAPGVRCSLEHGGIAPVIIDETVDIDTIIPKLIKGGFYHAGQVCVSVQRIFIHNSIKQQFVDKITEAAKRQEVGDPTLAATEIGPLIKPQEVDRVALWVDEAKNGGATITCGGAPLENQCYASTIVVDPPLDSKLMTHEVFGPVISINGFNNFDQAIKVANDKKWVFQTAIMTNDINNAVKASQKIDAATVIINDHTAFRVDWMPFGGHAQSGLALGGVKSSIKNFSKEKLIVINKLN